MKFPQLLPSQAPFVDNSSKFWRHFPSGFNHYQTYINNEINYKLLNISSDIKTTNKTKDRLRRYQRMNSNKNNNINNNL